MAAAGAAGTTTTVAGPLAWAQGPPPPRADPDSAATEPPTRPELEQLRGEADLFRANSAGPGFLW